MHSMVGHHAMFDHLRQEWWQDLTPHGTQAAFVLAYVLEHNFYLEELTITNNAIGKSGGRAIMDAVKVCKKAVPGAIKYCVPTGACAGSDMGMVPRCNALLRTTGQQFSGFYVGIGTSEPRNLPLHESALVQCGLDGTGT